MKARTLSCAVFAAAATIVIAASPRETAGIPAQDEIVSKVDLSYLVGSRRPIWMGPVIRYTVYETTNVEARVTTFTGELVLILHVGVQEPGQYTLPWDGTSDEGLVTFEGKYQFELFFGDEYGANFWFSSKSLITFDE